MPILNYTTSISSDKSIMEIQRCLVTHGAHKVIVDYQDKMPVAVSFGITMNGRMVAFSLPCNYTGVFNALKRSSRVPRKLKTEEQALRVAWRILKDWTEAQMAIVEAGLAELPEVFLPYAVTKSGGTLYREIKENGSPLLLSEEGRVTINQHYRR